MRSINHILLRKKSSKRTDIQALRAIAVLAVVIYHIYPTRLTGGFIGVDVFFVISGYLMTLTIWNGVKETVAAGRGGGKSSLNFLANFYARRIKRLAPAATVCLIAVLVAVFLIGNFSLQLQTVPQVIASAIFLQNWFLADQSVDYLGANAGATAVQHFWSLSIEEQFYMIWPLLLLAVGLCTVAFYKRKHQSKSANVATGGGISAYLGKPIQVAPLVAVCLFTIISFVYGLQLTYSNPALAYFVTPARIWELSLGGIIALVPAIAHRDLRLLLPYLGLGLIIYPFIAWDGVDFPGWHALVPTLGTALVILGGKGEREPSVFSVANLARLRPLQFFGDTSYSLYLWHWPLIVLVPYVLNINLNNNASSLKVTLLLVAIAVSWISYKAIETPFRNLGTRSKRSMRAVVATWATGGLCLALILAPANVIIARATYYSDNIVQLAFERAMDPNDIGFGARATMHRGEAGVPDNPYGVVDTNFTDVATEVLYGIYDDPHSNGVSVGAFDTFASSRISIDSVGEFGDISSSKTMLVLGDSHSMQWYGALDVAAKNLGYKVISAGTWHAAGGLFELTYDFGDTWPDSKGNPLSIKRANERFEWIRNNLWLQADIIVVGVTQVYYIGEPQNTSPDNTSDAATKIAQTFMDIASVTGKKPILIQDNPHLSYYSKDISCVAAENKWKAENYQINALYNRLANVGAIDTFNYLETKSLFVDSNEYAHTWVGGVPVYYDDSHINTLYSASCGEYFTEQLRAMIS